MVIIKRDDAQIVDYWSVIDGWVESLKDASKYTKKQVANYAYELPLGGEWEEIKDS